MIPACAQRVFPGLYAKGGDSKFSGRYTLEENWERLVFWEGRYYFGHGLRRKYISGCTLGFNNTGLRKKNGLAHFVAGGISDPTLFPWFLGCVRLYLCVFTGKGND
ncbi:unnamed protein product [Arctogadus glacialis]